MDKHKTIYGLYCKITFTANFFLFIIFPKLNRSYLKIKNMTDLAKGESSKLDLNHLMYQVLLLLKANNNEMQLKDIFTNLEKSLDLSAYDRAAYEKSGAVRWQNRLQFSSIRYSNAGYLVKKRGIWFLTAEGLAVLNQGESRLLEEVKKTNTALLRQKNNAEPSIGLAVSEESRQNVILDETEEQAREGLISYIRKKNPYEFQDLVAALLRGMGYYTPFIAPRGKDGGIDIIAYKDPLGAVLPRILVQVKHKDKPDNKATKPEVCALNGVLQKENYVGLFVSSTGFTADAKAEALRSRSHIELIDLSVFIDLWQSFYSKLSDQDKNLLPLRPIYFLDI